MGKPNIRRDLKLPKLFSVLMVTFWEENGLTEVEESDSNDTHVMTMLTKMFCGLEVTSSEEYLS